MRLFLQILYLIIAYALKCMTQIFRYYIKACVLLHLDVRNQTGTIDLKWVLHCYVM